MRLLQVFCLSTRAGDMTGFDGNVPKTEHRTYCLTCDLKIGMEIDSYLELHLTHSSRFHT